MQGAWNLPEHKMMATEERRAIIEVAKTRDPFLYPLLVTGANTGLRCCELIHIRCEDVLGKGKLRVTRRKKKVLQPEVMGILPDLEKILMGIKEQRPNGWLFPGGAGACVLERRPQFKKLVCPDCNKQIADPSLYKKSADLKRLFFAHLTQEHRRDAMDVSMWMEFESESTKETLCGGGHISKRDVQYRWTLILAEAKLRMPGRGIHSLRHGFAIDFYNKTKDLRATQMALGHSSPVVTQKYANVLDMDEKLRKMEPLI